MIEKITLIIGSLVGIVSSIGILYLSPFLIMLFTSDNKTVNIVVPIIIIGTGIFFLLMNILFLKEAIDE